MLEKHTEELKPENYIGFLISDREDYDLHILYLESNYGKIECEFYYNIKKNIFIEVENSELKKKSIENAKIFHEEALEESRQTKLEQDLYDEQMLKNN